MPAPSLNRFLTDTRGNIAIIATFSILPIAGLIGLAVDYSQINRKQANIQQALDAAALAVATQLGKEKSDKALGAFAKNFFQANLRNIDPSRIGFTYHSGNAVNDFSIKLSANYQYRTIFGAALGRREQKISAQSVVKVGNDSDSLEIALVLDNSGSMRSNDRIGAAKKAASSLVDQLSAAMQGSNQMDFIRFALVPFGGQVNVGPQNASQDWMDTTGRSPIHHVNLAWERDPRAIAIGDGRFQDPRGNWLTRFTLFDDMVGARWAGCVEARPYPFHTTDTPADAAKPASLFVPAFAPDEPDDYSGQREVLPAEAGSKIYCQRRKKKNQCHTWSDGYRGNIHKSGSKPNLDWRNYWNTKKRKMAGNGEPYGGYDGGASRGKAHKGKVIREERYNNSYLNDDGNIPSGINALAPENTGSGAEQNKRQGWTWKYADQRPLQGSFTGPNHGCTTNPITPLTADTRRLKSALAAMQADGLTNVPLGIAWGWRSLSAAPPFTEGRPSTAGNNRKIMIVMTDGNNYYGTQDNYNLSYYGAHGLQQNGRLFDHFDGARDPRHTSENYQLALDEHMLETCANARADGIRIYTIAFDLRNGSSVKKTLQACASRSPTTGERLYFDASGSAQLLAAFNRIGSEVSQLRIAE